MWDPERLTTLLVFTACYKDNFTDFTLLGDMFLNFFNKMCLYGLTLFIPRNKIHDETKEYWCVKMLLNIELENCYPPVYVQKC
jgi:hypothetical protein